MSSGRGDNSSNNNNIEQPTISEALKTIKVEDFQNVGKIPCARNSLLYGIGAGFGMGGIRFMLKRTVPTAANWAVGTFCGVSLIAFEMCQMDRKQKTERLHLIIKETNSRQTVKEQIKKGGLQVIVDTPTQGPSSSPSSSSSSSSEQQ